MTKTIEIQPIGPARATVSLPGSKSITNRALICAALADGQSTLSGALDSEDTRVMIAALGQLGIDVRHDPQACTLEVSGCGGNPTATEADLYIANSGTSVRFLTAMVTTGRGKYRLHGTPRMHQRPIADLLDALKQLGANVRSEANDGNPPVVVEADGLPGGKAEVSGDISSQFLSGLLMAAPCAKEDVELSVRGTLVSKPYVEMTLAVMRDFGVDIQTSDLQSFVIPKGSLYRPTSYRIEPDASAASYFFAAAAITGGEVTVKGLSKASIQGDVDFCDCLEKMGCRVSYGEDSITVTGGGPLRGIDVDMNAISVTVQTLAAVALFADGPTNVSNVGHIRHKETDRIGDLARELRKLGAQVDEREDGMLITPGKPHGAEIDTYDDHRMAMSLSLVGLKIPGVIIRDPDCTAKTYPKFFEDLGRLG
jgi:3-phosphoshikimate 1-carboxyvinyltransferase